MEKSCEESVKDREQSIKEQQEKKKKGEPSLTIASDGEGYILRLSLFI